MRAWNESQKGKPALAFGSQSGFIYRLLLPILQPTDLILPKLLSVIVDSSAILCNSIVIVFMSVPDDYIGQFSVTSASVGAIGTIDSESPVGIVGTVGNDRHCRICR